MLTTLSHTCLVRDVINCSEKMHYLLLNLNIPEFVLNKTPSLRFNKNTKKKKNAKSQYKHKCIYWKT